MTPDQLRLLETEAERLISELPPEQREYFTLLLDDAIPRRRAERFMRGLIDVCWGDDPDKPQLRLCDAEEDAR